MWKIKRRTSYILFRIGYEGSGVWMLEKVEIADSTNDRLHFPCRRWPDKSDDHDIGLVEQEILPIDTGMFNFDNFHDHGFVSKKIK